MDNFMDLVNETIENDKKNSLVLTENGGIAHKSSGHYLVDINYATSSLRSAEPVKIIEMFHNAYKEDPSYSILWLFYASDVRGGMGERRLFKILFQHLSEINPEATLKLLRLVPEYSRWDNLWPLLYSSNQQISDAVMEMISTALSIDMDNMRHNQPISLLAKWLPSNNTSSRKSRDLALKIELRLGLSARKYRKMLSALRRYLDLVEIHASNNDWSGIDYEKVPSRANLIYKDAFMKHDEDRRIKYLDPLSKGESKINGSVNFPHDVAHKYLKGLCHCGSIHDIIYRIDPTVEALWNALPDYVNGNDSTLVIADSSGSMGVKIGGTDVAAIEVAYALGVYFAEKLSGPYHNKMITFSENPKYIELLGTSLKDNLNILLGTSEIANTNIERTMALILRTAVENDLKQEELPSNILILSDGEFDYMADIRSYNNNAGFRYWGSEESRKSDFDLIKDKFKEKGYKLPKITFWNLNSRTMIVPIKQNDLGVNLVSGFSPAVIKLVLTGKTDPYDALKTMLDDKRYDPVREALAKED